MPDFVSARFRRSIDHLLALEGGYVNHPADRGGPTKFGISQRAYPDLNVKTLTRDQAIDIYHEDYWLKLKCDKFASERVASLVFAFGVNAGIGTAAKALQTALNGLGRPLACDGKVGAATLAAANAVADGKLLPAIEGEILRHYRAVVKRNPSQAVFLKGWENRVRASSGKVA
jgi:lysozyme family protein